MGKTQDVQKDMMLALKNKDTSRKETLSLLLSALKAKAKDKREPLTEEEENAIILKEIKQTQETLQSAADRADIADECRERLSVLQEFAPARMDEEEIRRAVKSVLQKLGLSSPTVREKGAVMKTLMPLISGKADGALVNKVVGEFLQ